ncbi:MAG: TonB-dependent receptor, partial [Proteobacteria bacterium]|nr:TonB-dependent receptor [Pseudomonadota bacterium]
MQARMIKPLASGLLTTMGVVLAVNAEEPVTTQLETVLVTAPIPQTVADTARPVTVLTENDLVSKAANTIGQTLQQELGMNSQSFGPGVGSPVIRGQAGPRVRVMQNGIGNNDVSALSPDHANSVEPLLADRIEVLRGPATLLYGSGAIGGVVNVIDNRIPAVKPDKPVGGAFEQRYNSVSDENASTLKLEGGHGNVAYHVDGFYREQGNTHIGGSAIDEDAARAADPSLEGVDPIENSRGVIRNSNARAKGGTVGLSLVGEAGFAGAAINHLENNYGIPPDGSGGDPIRVDLRQTKYDFKGDLKQPFALAEALRLKFGYTDYEHVELDGGVPGTTYTNQSYESRLELVHVPLGFLHGVIGFQSINSEFAALGEEAVVPKSKIDTYAMFAVESLDVGSVTYELGLRAEHQSIAPDGLKESSHAPVSGSASALWKIDDTNQLSLAFTQSQRAPQVQELYSDGVHEATRSYEVGDPGLKKETSYNLDLGYRFRQNWASAEFNLFHNWVSDYIFQQRTGAVFNEGLEAIENACSAPGECIPVMQSRQADAIFRGFEAKVVLPLLESRHGLVDLTLFSDYTRGEFVQGGDVPRMPPLRYGLQLDYGKDEFSANVRLTR